MISLRLHSAGRRARLGLVLAIGVGACGGENPRRESGRAIEAAGSEQVSATPVQAEPVPETSAAERAERARDLALAALRPTVELVPPACPEVQGSAGRGPGTVCVIDTSTGLTRATMRVAAGQSPKVARSGDELIFVVPDSYSVLYGFERQVWRWSLATGELTPLTRSERGDERLVETSDGVVIVAGIEVVPDEVLRVAADGSLETIPGSRVRDAIVAYELALEAQEADRERAERESAEREAADRRAGGEPGRSGLIELAPVLRRGPSAIHRLVLDARGLAIVTNDHAYRLDAAGVHDVTSSPELEPVESGADSCVCVEEALRCGAVDVARACVGLEALVGARARAGWRPGPPFQIVPRGELRAEHITMDLARVVRLSDGAALWLSVVEGAVLAQADDGSFAFSSPEALEGYAVRRGRSILTAPVEPLAAHRDRLRREGLVEALFSGAPLPSTASAPGDGEPR